MSDGVNTVGSARPGKLAALVDSDAFNAKIAVVIVANALVLGLATFPGVAAGYGSLLEALNAVFYVVFVVELVLRIASYGRRPWEFFRNGWNVFDFVIIFGALIPALGQRTQIVRLLRLARVVRLVRFLPDARILIATIARALPSLGSMVVLTFLLLFVYGMIGWDLFGQALPQDWGTIGRAMLTLFVLLTLENFPTYLEEAAAVTPWAGVFFISYVLLAAFVVFNLLIGIIIGSMEEAREREARQNLVGRTDAQSLALTRILEIRGSLDQMETELLTADTYAPQPAVVNRRGSRFQGPSRAVSPE